MKWAEKRGSLCKKCALEKTRATCRSPEWRVAQSQRQKDARKKENSVFNTEEYHKSLSDAQKRYWATVDEDTRNIRLQDLIINCVQQPARLEAFHRSLKNPEHKERRRQGIIKAWQNDPERHFRQSEQAKQRMLDPDYKRRCTEKFYYSSGGVSKVEQELAEKLVPLGWVQQHNISGYYVDFYNPTTNSVIEYYGKWWHCHPMYDEKINTLYGGIHPYLDKTPEEIRTKDQHRIDKIKETVDNVTILWEGEELKL